MKTSVTKLTKNAVSKSSLVMKLPKHAQIKSTIEFGDGLTNPVMFHTLKKVCEAMDIVPSKDKLYMLSQETSPKAWKEWKRVTAHMTLGTKDWMCLGRAISNDSLSDVLWVSKDKRTVYAQSSDSNDCVFISPLPFAEGKALKAEEGVIKVTVDHVCISKKYDPDCRVKFKATANKVVCSTKGFRPDITIMPKGVKFVASMMEPTSDSFKVRLVVGKTPAKTFAKAVKKFWAN